MTDPVECASSAAYADRPTALYWEGKRLPVEKIVSRWSAPNGQYFLVVAQAQLFEICYQPSSDGWQIQLI